MTQNSQAVGRPTSKRQVLCAQRMPTVLNLHTNAMLHLVYSGKYDDGGGHSTILFRFFLTRRGRMANGDAGSGPFWGREEWCGEEGYYKMLASSFANLLASGEREKQVSWMPPFVTGRVPHPKRLIHEQRVERASFVDMRNHRMAQSDTPVNPEKVRESARTSLLRATGLTVQPSS